jgi:SAM-dependent methyltransferase
MDEITENLKTHYRHAFEQYGATSRGVNWSGGDAIRFLYDKMLAVLQKDFAELPAEVSLLDVGCGYGGLLAHARSLGLKLRYTGVDVVGSMIEHGRTEFPDAEFIEGNVLDLSGDNIYDFVVCCGIAPQKLSATIPEFEEHTRRLVRKMHELCRHGIALDMYSTRVNFMVDNLYYQNPSEFLSWALSEISPRVRIDHGFSSLASGVGKWYEFVAYIYKD